MERYTTCTVELDLFDTTAMSDATFTTYSIQPFSDIEKIRKPNDIVKIATMENDLFLLDGSYSYMDDVEDLTDHVGYMSDAFNTTLRVNFANNHSSIGMTFNFWDVYPDSVEISYRKGTKLIATGLFHPDRLTYIAEILADNYDNIEINFFSNDRYTRINNINFGIALIYGEDSNKKLKTCSITEELDVTSSEITVNESKVEVIDSEDLFKITNPRSYYKYLQSRQMFIITETINDETKLMGKHYLKEWEQTNDHVATFTLQDVIGLMGDTTFYGGMYYRTSAAQIIQEIMEDYGYENYIVEEDVANILLDGYIKICSHREALQQVAFACSAAVDTSRSDVIRIYKPTYQSMGLISKDRKLTSNTHKITQDDLVTEVVVKAHEYVLTDEEKQLYKGILGPGEHRITFKNPASSITVTGATIKENGCNYALVDVAEETEVVCKGLMYEDHYSEFRYTELTDLPSATEENTLKVDNATLVSRKNAEDVAKFIYYIKQYRLKHELKAITINECVGEMYSLATANTYAPLLITKMTTDLTGGYISDIEGIGYALREIEAYRMTYPTYELFAGDGGIL